MMMIHYSKLDRQVIAGRLAKVLKFGVKKCDVARELNMPWPLVHNVASKKRLPHPLTCMVLGPWLARKEKELGIGK